LRLFMVMFLSQTWRTRLLSTISATVIKFVRIIHPRSCCRAVTWDRNRCGAGLFMMKSAISVRIWSLPGTTNSGAVSPGTTACCIFHSFSDSISKTRRDLPIVIPPW